MDNADVTNLENRASIRLATFLKSLHDISASSATPPAYCLQNKGVGKKTAVWLDDVLAQRDWTDLANRRAQKLACAHRIDGFFVKGLERYLIEFKCDSNIDPFENDFFRKFYESFLQLLRHNWISVAEAEEHLTYIVVHTGKMAYTEKDIRKAFLTTATEREKNEIRLGLTSPYNCDMLRFPWKYPNVVRPRCNLDLLELMGCKRVLTLTAYQFEAFVAQEQWT